MTTSPRSSSRLDDKRKRRRLDFLESSVSNDIFIDSGLPPPSPLSEDDTNGDESGSKIDTIVSSMENIKSKSKRRRRSNPSSSRIEQENVILSSEYVSTIANDEEAIGIEAIGIENEDELASETDRAPRVKSIIRAARFKYIKEEGSNMYHSLIENAEWRPDLTEKNRRNLAKILKEARWREIAAKLRKESGGDTGITEISRLGPFSNIPLDPILEEAISSNNVLSQTLTDQVDVISSETRPKRASFPYKRLDSLKVPKANRMESVLARAEGLTSDEIRNSWEPKEIYDLAVARYEQRELLVGGSQANLSEDIIAYLKSLEHVGRYARSQSFLCPICSQQKTTRAGMEYHLIKRVCRNRIAKELLENETVVSTTDSKTIPSLTESPHDAFQVIPEYECPVCLMKFKSSSGAKFHIVEKMYCLPGFADIMSQKRSSKRLLVNESVVSAEKLSQKQADQVAKEKAAILASPERVTRLQVIKKITKKSFIKSETSSSQQLLPFNDVDADDDEEEDDDDVDDDDRSLEDAIDDFPRHSSKQHRSRSSRKVIGDGAPTVADPRLNEIIRGNYEVSFQRVLHSRTESSSSSNIFFHKDLLVDVKVDETSLYKSAAGMQSSSPPVVHFSSTSHDSSTLLTSDPVIQFDFSAGGAGPIWALDVNVAVSLQPTSSSSSSSLIDAFVAVSHHSLARPTLRPIGSVSSGRNVLHFWHISSKMPQNATLSDDDAIGSTTVSAKHYLGVAHDCDTVLDVEWCPHFAPSMSQAGILAAVMGDGVVRIYAIPHPDAISSQVSSEHLTHLIPIACCATPGHPASCIRWSRQKPGLLGVGTATGATMVFDILSSIRSERSNDISTELFSAETGFRTKAMSGRFLPSSLRIFANETFFSTTVMFLPPGTAAVRDLSFSPISSPFGLLACAHSDGSIRLWNDTDGRIPILEYSFSQRPITSLDFMSSGTSLIIATETGEISELSLLQWVAEDIISVAAQPPSKLKSQTTDSLAQGTNSVTLRTRMPCAREVRSLWIPSSAQVQGNCIIAYALADGFVGILPSFLNQEKKESFGIGGRKRDAKKHSLCVSESIPPIATHVARLFAGSPLPSSVDGASSQLASLYLPQLSAHRVRCGFAQISSKNFCILVTGGAEGRLRFRIININEILFQKFAR